MADGNPALAAAIAEAGLTHAQVARVFVRVAIESGAVELAGVGRSHVSHWVRGSQPSGRAPLILSEALSRRLGRPVTPEAIGLGREPEAREDLLDWRVDTLAALADLGRVDVDLERRRVLEAAAYSLAALAMPDATWWEQMARSGRSRSASDARRVGRSDVDAAQDMVALFSRVDQRRGGGHARTAVVQYLASDVARYLRGRFTDEALRRDMFTAAAELAYLSGWMAFDNAEHVVAQHHLTLAVKLAAEADNLPMQGHVLRAMAHQAVDLGHPREALALAEASVAGARYVAASPRERALLGIVHARSLAINRRPSAAAKVVIRAEDDLAGTTPGDDEPDRVFFFSEASLAHETACTLRDSGDLAGAMRHFRRSVRLRHDATFTRTHAVTLGYLGEVQARSGELESACLTWSRALDAMDGVRSGRTRAVARTIRASLSSYRGRRIAAVVDVDTRASRYLATSL